MIGHGAFLYCKHTKRFLFLLRNGPDRHEYTWSIVGGRQEEEESPRECLIREIEEETGRGIYITFVPLDSFTSENGRFVYNTYFCALEKEFVPNLNDEHCGYCWVPLDNFPRPMHPGVFNSIKEEETRLILLELITQS